MCNSDMQLVFGIIVSLFDLIRFVIPILLIVLCTIDIFKIIVSKKEDEIKKLRKEVIMKVVYAIIIYLLPFLIPMFFRLANNIIPFDYSDEWKECWDYVENSKKNN